MAEIKQRERKKLEIVQINHRFSSFETSQGGKKSTSLAPLYVYRGSEKTVMNKDKEKNG